MKTNGLVSDLCVKVNVDVAEAITGLKALQREARKTTQALAELNAVSGVLAKYENIRWDGEPHQVVCADDDIAVVGPIVGGKGGYVDHTRLFSVSNRPDMYAVIADHVTKEGA